MSALALSALMTHAQTDVTSTYIQNADFSSTEGWTINKSTSFSDAGSGLIGTYNVRSQSGQASTTDDTHTSEKYCIGVEARWNGNYASYTQSVTLPAGVYTLSYDVENRNTATTSATYSSLFSFNEVADASTEWMKGATEWTSHSISIDLEEETAVTISLGYGTGSNNFHANNTPVLYISNLKLTGYTYAEKLAELQTEASKIDQTQLNAGINGVLATAISNAETAQTTATADALKASIEELGSAITLANSSIEANTSAVAAIAAAQAVLDNSTAKDEGVFATAIEKAQSDLDAATTVEAINTTVSTLESARQTYVQTAVPNDGYTFDYTFAVEGVGNSTSGWTKNVTSGSVQNFVYKNSSEKNNGEYVKTGFIENWNGKAYTETLTYTKTGLRNGHYSISAYAFTVMNGITYFIANDKSVALDNTTALYTKPVIADVTVLDGTLTFGLDVQNCNWVGITNIELQYISELTAEDLTEALTNLWDEGDQLYASVIEKTVKEQLTEALNGALEAINSEDLETKEQATASLKTAITAAEASIAAYTAAANVLPKMKELTESTNFYTEDAKTTYYTQWQTKYEEGTLTTDEANALQDPTVANYNARKTKGMAPKFLLDAWDDGGTIEDNSVTQGSYYINTWSTEGTTDGSGMTVPFFEYWVSDANTLAANTLTGTLSGLTADQVYSVSALVRVHVTNDATDGTGITMQVGDGETVDVCGGTPLSNNYNYGTYTAYGKTDSEGNLTVKFIVAEGTNISWLSFKNVNYVACDAVTFNEKAVENETYFATYTTKTAVDLDKCEFTAYSVSVSGTSVAREELSGIVPAGTPLLLSASEAKTYDVASTSAAATTEVNTELKSSDGTVVGDESTIYTLNFSNNVLGWYLKKKDVAIAEGKCYLEVEANGAKFLGFSDGATGINTVKNATQNGVRYNVSGQRVDNSYKGIVIENGKKYLVK